MRFIINFFMAAYHTQMADLYKAQRDYHYHKALDWDRKYEEHLDEIDELVEGRDALPQELH